MKKNCGLLKYSSCNLLNLSKRTDTCIEGVGVGEVEPTKKK